MGFSGKWIELKATMFHDIIEIVKINIRVYKM